MRKRCQQWGIEGVYGGKNLGAKKIWVEYLSFHGGDFIPLWLKYNTVYAYTPPPEFFLFF